MQQFSGMIRDTWWLWLLIFIVVTVLIFAVHPVFCAMYPLLGGFAVYFAVIRYNDDGSQKRM